MANSRVPSLQQAVFQPIFLKRLQSIAKCKPLQETLTKERRLCDYVTKTQPDGMNSEVNLHINSLREL